MLDVARRQRFVLDSPKRLAEDVLMAIVQSMEHSVHVCMDGSVTHLRCDNGVAMTFVVDSRSHDFIGFDPQHPFLKRVKDTVEEATGGRAGIIKDNFVFNVYLNDLIPLGKVSGSYADILVEKRGYKSFEEAKKDLEEKKYAILQRIPGLRDYITVNVIEGNRASYIGVIKIKLPLPGDDMISAAEVALNVINNSRQ